MLSAPNSRGSELSTMADCHLGYVWYIYMSSYVWFGPFILYRLGLLWESTFTFHLESLELNPLSHLQVLEGQKVVPAKAKELGFPFKYRYVKDAIKAILS